jgi:hypothetical protein
MQATIYPNVGAGLPRDHRGVKPLPQRTTPRSVPPLDP